MSETNTLTPIHCIFYIYHTFAFRSDDKLTLQEKKTITKFMYRWVGKDQNKTTKIINETLTWSKQNIKSVHDQIGAMISMVEFLKTQKNFNIDTCEYLLMDIRNIARSDGNFLDQQKKWHDMLSNILGLGIRVSAATHDDINGAVKQVHRRKIGFRR